MRGQPNTGYNSDDVVQTPQEICDRVIGHFKPVGDVLEPCSGEGHFLDSMRLYAGGLTGIKVDWCEIQKGRDFYQHDSHCDWIITNPPFGQIRSPRGKDTHPMSFVEKCFQVADNVVLLLTLNHAIGLKSRFKMADEHGFSIREIILLDTPPVPWPQSGFQVGCIHWRKDKLSAGLRTKTYLVTDWRLN